MPRKPPKDRTSLVISVVIHAVLIGGIVFWAYKTGKLEQMRQAVLQYVKGEKREEKKPEAGQQKQVAAPKLPPINQGLKAPESSGTRRAVAADAPEAAGGASFFQDTRRQVEGPSAAGGAARPTNAPVVRPSLPRPPVAKPLFAPASTSVKQLLQERAKASTIVESFGAEQISKAAVKDVGDIVAKISGSTIVEGKFAVIRGLSDRYTSTLLNGAEVPSGDPYRRSVPLDLFPASMIERVAISKAFTPDQPGGTGGSTIDVVTKSFPERTFLKFTTGYSYNENSNLKGDFLADPRSAMSLYDLPGAPRALDDQYFALSTAPPLPTRASVRETAASAATRRTVADTHQALLQSLGPADFAGVAQDSPLNANFSASAGDTLFLFRRPLGLVASLNYSRNFRAFQDSEVSRANLYREVEKSGLEDKSNISTDYGANLNLGYRLFDHLELGFNILLAHTTDEEAIHTTSDFLLNEPGTALEQWQLHFTERAINNFQFRGKLELPGLADSQLDWVVNLADTFQNEPDHRFLNYFVDETGNYTLGAASLPVPSYPSRYFREITDDALNAKLDWKIPFWFAGRESSFKTGLFDSQANRDFREQYFSYAESTLFDVANPNAYLNNPAYLSYTPVWLGPVGTRIGTNYNFIRTINLAASRPYTASSDVSATYWMADVGALPWLRLIGGARLERTDMQIDAFASGNSQLQQTDLLPSLSGVVSLATNLSLRLGYAESVARPSFREKSPILNYLPDRKLFASGNAHLAMAAITSYDARLEWFPAPGEIVSLGAFYKELTNPVELYLTSLDGNDITWINRPTATVMGLEFEARKSLRFVSPFFDGFTLGANLALISSETALTESEYQNKTDVDRDGVIDFPTPRQRPLYDQSPYVINLDLSYDNPRSGTTCTLSANLTGERISLTRAQGEDLYQHPPVLVDFGVSQKLGRNLRMRFGVRNLLDDDYLETYGSRAEGALYQKYQRGRTYSLSLSAEF